MLALHQFVFEGDTYFLGTDCLVTISEFASHQESRQQYFPHGDKKILRTCLKCYSFIKYSMYYWPGGFVFSSFTRTPGIGDMFGDKEVFAQSTSAERYIVQWLIVLVLILFGCFLLC